MVDPAGRSGCLARRGMIFLTRAINAARQRSADTSSDWLYWLLPIAAAAALMRFRLTIVCYRNKASLTCDRINERLLFMCGINREHGLTNAC